MKTKKRKRTPRRARPQVPDNSFPIGRQEHDDVMRALGHPPEGDGQEHSEVMEAILGHGNY